ncbi:hypothetical protein TNCV_4440851 [Trichonephila clavipes]|nr:hypothetical protein TNCV_4440851 [Trichonephila clavipes]
MVSQLWNQLQTSGTINHKGRLRSPQNIDIYSGPLLGTLLSWQPRRTTNPLPSGDLAVVSRRGIGIFRQAVYICTETGLYARRPCQMRPLDHLSSTPGMRTGVGSWIKCY